MTAGFAFDEADESALLPIRSNIVGVAAKSSWEERPLEEQSLDVPTLLLSVLHACSICLMLLYTVDMTAAVAFLLLTVAAAARTSRNPAQQNFTRL